MKKNDFAVGVEKLVNPIDVGTLHFVQNFTGALPLRIQKKMVQSSAKITPYMGFVVDPYSYFLNYEIKDLEWAKRLLPKDFKMVKTHVFDNDTPRYYGVFGIFNAHTSGFFGLRVEFYLIAEDTRTGLLSWVIIDYDTNTISYDPKSGFRKPNVETGVFTIDYNGIIQLDMQKDDGSHGLVLTSDVTKGVMRKLDKRLWIEGNLSVGYGAELSDDTEVFSLKFDPKEFTQALEISNEDLNVELNSWFPGLFGEAPEVIVCFPYAQHYLSDSPGSHSQIKSETELKENVEKIDFNMIQVFSTESFKTMLVAGMVISFLINITLLMLLII